MKNISLPKTLKIFRSSISKISKRNNVDWLKEEIILIKLESKLEKSKQEVNNLISRDLMSLLTMVPFTK